MLSHNVDTCIVFLQNVPHRCAVEDASLSCHIESTQLTLYELRGAYLHLTRSKTFFHKDSNCALLPFDVHASCGHFWQHPSFSKPCPHFKHLEFSPQTCDASRFF